MNRKHTAQDLQLAVKDYFRRASISANTEADHRAFRKIRHTKSRRNVRGRSSCQLRCQEPRKERGSSVIYNAD